jgi:hypothetical protein
VEYLIYTSQPGKSALISERPVLVLANVGSLDLGEPAVREFERVELAYELPGATPIVGADDAVD